MRLRRTISGWLLDLREVPLGLLLRRGKAKGHYHYRQGRDGVLERVTEPWVPGRRKPLTRPGSFKMYCVEDERAKRSA